MLAGCMLLVRPAATVVAGGLPSAGETTAARGQALFLGKEAMIGKPRDHADPMPPEVVVCSHCHAAAKSKVAGVTDAPTLDAATLLEHLSRRHGPPSAYDQKSFCKVLRTGVDPVYILVQKTMPVYVLDESQCGSLWMFLTAENGEPGK